MGYVCLNEGKCSKSVPYRYNGNHVEIQHTIDSVEIYFKKNI